MLARLDKYLMKLWQYILCLFRNGRTYNPRRWNYIPIKIKNNCYNYACDIQTDTMAQPGKASGNNFSNVNCKEIHNSVISDGLAWIGSQYHIIKCKQKVALVIAPSKKQLDFHWFRQDDNGKWSHKPGKTAVTNLDNSGNEITDPETADRGPYTIFCGYYCVCSLNISIR